MYLRRSSRTNRDGTVTSYLSLAHNCRDPDSGVSKPKILHSFGREDELDPEALEHLMIARRRRRGQPKIEGRRLPLLGLRWTVERINSWLSNHGQLRRNTDRRTIHRLAQLALAVVLIITAKLIDWHDRWNRP